MNTKYKKTICAGFLPAKETYVSNLKQGSKRENREAFKKLGALHEKAISDLQALNNSGVLKDV